MAENTGTVAGAGVSSGAVGTALGAIVNYYAGTPVDLQPSMIVVVSWLFGVCGAWIAHLLTRVDANQDGVPDALQQRGADHA